MTREQWLQKPREVRMEAKRHFPLALALEYQPKIFFPGKGLIPYEPWECQQTFLNDPARHRILNKARQMGFSTTVAEEIAWKLGYKPGAEIPLVSQDENASKNLLAYVRRFVQFFAENDPDYPAYDPRKDTAFGIRVGNGNYVRALRSSKKTGRSFSASDIYFDEMAHASFAEDIYTSVVPTIAASGGSVTGFSTPKGRANLFGRMVKDPADYGMSYHEYPWWFSPIYNPYYRQWTNSGDPKWIEKAKEGEWYKKTRRQFSEAQFRQEFECSTDADVGTVFTQGQLLSLFRRNYLTQMEPSFVGTWYQSEPEAGHFYALGGDLGRKKDATVIAVFDYTERPARMVCYKRIEPGNADWGLIIDEFRRTAAKFRPSALIESNGPGDPIVEILSDIAEPFVMSNHTASRVKYNLIENVRRAADERAVEMPKIEPLYTEFERYQWDDRDLVQDSVIATAIAISVFYEPEAAFTGFDSDFSIGAGEYV